MFAKKQYDEPAANELLEWTATEAIGHIRNGSITAERYASELLKRYRESKALNAITWIDENRVLESARSVDTARSKGQTLGPLAGLPMVFMDMINTVGHPTTGGTQALKGFYPQRNAVVTDILLKNGAIVLGKANMHELGRGVTNSNPAYGFTKNPYDMTRVPGGGAGGSASAIAARISPAGIATDTAGSARMPAGLCGIAGLRPSGGGRKKAWSLGSWTVTTVHDGILPISYALTSPAPMGRTVSDVALLHAIVTGTTASTPLVLRGARIGVPRGFFWEDLEPEVARVAEQALEKLRHAGVVLVDVDLRQFVQVANPTFLTLATMNNLQDLASFITTNVPGVSMSQVVAGVLSRDVQAALKRETDNPVPPERAEEAMRTRSKLALQYEEVLRMNDVSALVVPTSPVVAPLIRPEGDGPTDTIEVNGKQVPEFGTLLRNTLFAGVIGIPALAIPCGLSSSGLPIGLSFNGQVDGDSRLLGLGLSVEAVLGRLPAPVLRTSAPQPAEPPTIVRSPQPSPATPGVSDNTDHALTLLKQSAYLNFYGSFEEPGAAASGFAAKAPLRRYDVDFRIGGCGPGLRAMNLLGEECGNASLNWTFQQSAPSPAAGGRTRPFTMGDTFVFDSEGRNQLRGAGSGRMAASTSGDGRVAVDANGHIVEGTGIFAGVQGTYVLTGSCDRSRMNLRFTMRLMDPGGNFLTTSELVALDGAVGPDPFDTCLAFLGEPDPEYPVQRTPTGATVHELLRVVHTDFDRGRGSDALRSATTLGPIVGRWRTDVIFNPAELAGPGPADRSSSVKLPNIKIDFSDAADGTLEASITDGRVLMMSLPGLSGPLFRMTGFGPIGVGTGRFRNAKGVITMLGAIDLAPAAFSNLYMLHLVDPDGCFRC